MRKPKSRSFERLENRLVMAQFGLPWPNGQTTLSFVPDGTETATGPSTLSALLETAQSKSQWQSQILSAFQAWSQSAELDVGVVKDNGAPLGSLGNTAGDSRFGDIRIAAAPLASDVLAVSIPYDMRAGTLAGDIVLNSQYKFGAGQTDDQYDLYSVILHEAGHALGVDYQGTSGVLSALDLANMKGLYGPRQPDAFDKLASNNQIENATDLGRQSEKRSTTVEASLELGDVDHYRIVAESDKLEMHLDTRGISTLAPRISVFDMAGRRLAVRTIPGMSGGAAELELDKLRPGQLLTVRVERPSNSTGAVAGGYKLHFGEFDDEDADYKTLYAPTLEHAHQVTQLGTDSALVRARLGSNLDVDHFLWTAPKSGAFKIQVVATEANWQPQVDVFSGTGEIMPSTMIRSGTGEFVAEMDGVEQGDTLVVSVRSANPDDSVSNGRYDLTLGVQAPMAAGLALMSGTVDAENSVLRTLEIHESQYLQLRLSAQDGVSGTAAYVTVYDTNGKFVTSLLAKMGESNTLNTWLAAGDYLLIVRAVQKDGQSAPGLAFDLRAATLSDPVGPKLIDPTLKPKKPPVTTRTDSQAIYAAILKLIPPISGPRW